MYRRRRPASRSRTALYCGLALALTATVLAGQETWVVTAEPCLNLREIPDQDNVPLRCLSTGTRLNVREAVTGWKKVELDGGEVGWVSDEFIARLEAKPAAGQTSGAAAPRNDPSAVELRRLRAELLIAQEELDRFRALATARETELSVQLAAARSEEQSRAIDPAEHQLLIDELSASRARVDELTGQTEELAAQRQGAAERLAEVEQQITSLEAGGLAQGQRIDALVSESATLEQRATAAESRVEELERALESERQRASDLESSATRVDELEAALAEQTAELLDLGTENEHLRGRVAELGSQLATATTDSTAEADSAVGEPPPVSSPATTDVAAVDVAGPSPADSLPETIAHWAQAWSAQDPDLYLSFYADDFVPRGGLSRADWEQQRRQRLTAPEFIEVTISELTLDRVEGDRAVVRFAQSYRSDGFSDDVTKTLDLVRQPDGAWRISRERSN